MIAASLPIILSIWVLSFGLVVNAWHILQVSKRNQELQRRVFELEMERDFPGFRRPAPMAPDDQGEGGLSS